MQDKMYLMLRQNGKAKDERYYELRAGRELHVVHGKKKFALSLLALDDQGRRIYQYKKRWLILGIMAIAAMLLFSKLGQYWSVSIVPYLLSGLFFAALLFFMLLVYTFQRSYVFLSIHTRLPLVEFWINNPTRKEYHKFISALEHAIKQHRAEMKIPHDKQLAGELRSLRRVMEAGMLSESVYLAAKAKLLLLSDTC